MKDKLTGIDTEKLINYEVMGCWPIYKMTLREILKQLGAISKNGIIGFKEDSLILDLYPRKLHADAMGYGVDEQWITEASTDGKTYLNLFVETELPKDKLDTYLEEQRKIAEEIKEHYENRRQLEVSEG